MLCPNAILRFLYFCVCNGLSLNYIGYESDGNDMKATGGVTAVLLFIVIMKYV